MLFGAYLLQQPAQTHRRKRQPLAPTTIIGYCCLIRSHFTATLGFPFAEATPRWRRFVKGLQRKRPHERHLCRGLRAAHLRAAFQSNNWLRLDDKEATTKWAIVAVGRAGLLRPTEIIRMKRADLTFSMTPEPHAVIRVKALKKAPGYGSTPTLIARGDMSGADAFRALQRMLTFDPVPEQDHFDTPLFRSPTGGAFNVAQISDIVRRVARAAGEDPQFFSGRSLRVGGATDLHAAGADPYVIQLAGRWDSEAHRAYSRATEGQMLQLSHMIQRVGSDRALEDRFKGYIQSAAGGR